jgi:5'-methylthioadenosine phosphorylase
MSTDYDCWHESEEPVTWEIIQKTMNKNAENVKKLLFAALREIKDSTCSCREAVSMSIL